MYFILFSVVSPEEDTTFYTGFEICQALISHFYQLRVDRMYEDC